MYRFLYSCAFYLAIPFVLLRLVKRSIKEPDYRRDLGQRFGFFRSRRPGEVIWIHAVSAGETVAAAPLIKRLLIAGYPCLVTNMTPTGRERARVLLGDAVENCYAPYDIPDAINRFLSRNRPRLFITIDTELWPNMLAACERDGIPAAVINGRMAARSAEGYSRISVLTVPMMRSLDLIAAQTEPHAKRFIELGA
ncbi:MAG: 3-deoxy-D-manno-octulosonic acid transferase, partial [Gammaproteobacteria bacterium]|nr:3-deoxy-D-manno-octulosonic acid transferase [Gammaproteobacteria bacterium]